MAISPDYAAPRESAEIGSHSLLLLSFHGEKHGLVTKISAELGKLGFTSYLLKLHFILSLATIHIPQFAWVWDMGEAVHVEFPRPRPRPLSLGLLRGHGGQLRDKNLYRSLVKRISSQQDMSEQLPPRSIRVRCLKRSLYGFLTRWWRALSFDRGRNRATTPYY